MKIRVSMFRESRKLRNEDQSCEQNVADVFVQIHLSVNVIEEDYSFRLLTLE